MSSGVINRAISRPLHYQMAELLQVSIYQWLFVEVRFEDPYGEGHFPYSDEDQWGEYCGNSLVAI
jgi:hypothetical protein